MLDFPAWSKSVSEVLEHVRVNPANGLSLAEVDDRRTRYGFNELEKQPSTPLWKLVLSQFDDMLVKAKLSRSPNFLRVVFRCS